MFAVVLLPDFRLQAVLRQEPELFAAAVALADSEPPKPAIVHLTPAARACGVGEGMTPSQAMARCDRLLIKTRSPLQEQTAAEVLRQTAYAFSPWLEATQPGVCTMDLKGLDLQPGNGTLERWAGNIVQALAGFHLEAQVGIAATPALAWLAARAGRPWLIVPDSGDFVSGMPIGALEPPAEILELLDRWGIHTVGALLALGKESIVDRLGPAALALFERVSSDAVRPLNLAAPAGEFAEAMEFEHEIETVEPLWFVLRRFVEQLSRRLELLYQVVSGFQLRLGLASGDVYERAFRIPAPTGRVEVLFRILQTHLETVRTDSPITSLRLSAEPCRPETHQFGLFEASLRDPNQFAETLGRLTALCGSDRVGTPELEPTHRPDAFRLKPPEFAADRGTKVPADDPPLPGLPLRRFRPALAAQIEFRDRRPVSFCSSVFSGVIADLRGPFLSSGNWWEESRWAREEWDVQTLEGGLYRIFRCAGGDFVEGIYD
jgi:nucleotidyltransferase/DNA polymerase involved in DNA repair